MFAKATDDPSDAPALLGGWCWNELHTPDPERAVAFYQRVVGYSHAPRTMGPMDIPGVGRFGVVQDPTGGVLAVLKPLPPAA